MASQLEYEGEECVDELLDVPTEDSTNSVASFNVHANKLVLDKGSVKIEDVPIFKSQCAYLSHANTKWLILKKFTMKQEGEEEKLKRQFTAVKAQRVQHQRIWTNKEQIKPQLSQIDSPWILKSILNSKESNEKENKKFIESNWANKLLKPSNLFCEEELGLISENSNSVSE